MSIQKIGVIGAGQMGNGIAHVAAVAGYDVICQDISDEAFEKQPEFFDPINAFQDTIPILDSPKNDTDEPA